MLPTQPFDQCCEVCACMCALLVCIFVPVVLCVVYMLVCGFYSDSNGLAAALLLLVSYAQELNQFWSSLFPNIGVLGAFGLLFLHASNSGSFSFLLAGSLSFSSFSLYLSQSLSPSLPLSHTPPSPTHAQAHSVLVDGFVYRIVVTSYRYH